MFNFWRTIRKSAKEQQQETLNAYLDNALPAAERAAFEQKLAQDQALQAELAQIGQLKKALKQLPPRPLPRMFTLDPARYGRPQRFPAGRVYPVLRLATALTAFLFTLTLALTLFSTQSSPLYQNEASDELLMEEEALSAIPAAPTEIAAQDSDGSTLAEAPAGENAPEEIPAPAIQPTPEPAAATGNVVAETQNEGTASPTPSSLDLNPRPTASPTIDSLRTNPTPTASPTPISSPSPTAEATTIVPATTPNPLSPTAWFSIGLGLTLALLLSATLLLRRRL